YIQLALPGGPTIPRVSFQFFDMAFGLVPASITLRVSMRKSGVGATAVLALGFSRGATVASGGTVSTTSALYSIKTKVFTTNPLTGLAWALDDLVHLEP